MDLTKRRLAELVKPHGFIAKRDFYYREKGDGIFQFVKFEYEPWMSTHMLRFGLYSLYSEIDPHWLTPGGCISRYSVAALSNDIKYVERSTNAQLDTLSEHGIPWLDAIHTQRDLVDAMCEIEIREDGRIMWIDSLKLAPFLIDGDYLSANHVISTILQQHTGPDAWTTLPWKESDYGIYKTRYPGKDANLIQIHEWIRNSEHSIISSYLQQNYLNNKKILNIH